MTPVDLSSTSLGDGDPPLVLLHGYMGSTLDYSTIQPALADSRRVIAVDHRGHGRSPKAERYSFDLMVEDITLALKGLGPVHLMGHSMGGILAQRVALESPGLIASLILMDTAAEPAGKIPMALIKAVGGVGRITGMYLPLKVVATVLRQTGDGAAKDQREKLDALDPNAFVALARELNDYPSMVAQLPQLSAPTLVLVGENDKGLRRSAEVLSDQIPHARLVVVADAGHSPQIDQPAVVIQAIRDHLEGLAA